MLSRLFRSAGKLNWRLVKDRHGAVAVLFAATALMAITAVGCGLDLAHGYTARQQLSAIAELTCQYATRSNVVKLAFGSGGSSAYTSSVNTYYAQAFADQKVTWTQTTSPAFTYTPLGAGNVTLTAKVPTSFTNVIGVSSFQMSVSRQCFAIIATVSNPPVADAAATMLVQEGFENSASATQVRYYWPTGNITGYGTPIPEVNTPPTNAGYVGSNGSEWVVTGYCLENDPVGSVSTTVPEGSHGAELDCENGSDSAGNSSISTEVYMAAGNFELRWFYSARIPNTYYKTSYVCGSAASDSSWANDTSYTANSQTFGARTNQINVYLDQNTTGSPPVHTTLDGTQSLAGTNLIDECVYSSGWIERSVLITVTTPGYYWLSFAADGANDSFGGDIDNIRLCVGTCPGTVGSDFPPSWLPANNSGNNVLLFEDTFESPTYAGPTYNGNGNVGLSYGSSPSAYWGKSKGWSNAPVNQALYFVTGCPQATQCVDLGWSNDRVLAMPFLLDPGYYQISYYYVSQLTFSALSAVYCGTTPTAYSTITPNLSSGSGSGINRVTGTNQGTLPWQTGTLGVFMANAQMASEPNPSTTLGSTTTYTNPDGTVTTTPTVPPNNISLSSFVQSTTSPLLDICGYAATAQLRTRYISIQKSAFYWLLFSVFSPYNGYGAQMDDVKVIALGSLLMSGPPASFVKIPVPNPQPGATISYTGFSISGALQ